MAFIGFDLTDKVAVVTGGAQGLGFEMAGALASAGANVVIGDVQEEKAKQAASLLAERYRVRSLAISLDVTRRSSVEAAEEEIRREFDKIDILVNNAGVLIQKKIEDIKDEDWDYLMDINLKGVFTCSQIFGRLMVKECVGKIINMSSVVGFLGAENRVLYGVSKSGVAHMTRLFALEWAKHNINVNAIVPGYLLTDMTAVNFDDPVRGEAFLKMIPMQRFGVPKDLSGSIIFLASSASDYITGQMLVVDGGRTLI